MKEERDMRAEYEQIRAKYKLASLDDLDAAFNIASVDPSGNLIRNILFRVHDKYDFALKILGDLVQPENHLADMHEAEGLSDEDKKACMDLFRILAYESRQLQIADVVFEETAAAEKINNAFRVWRENSAKLKNILEKMRDSWLEKKSIDQEFGYFG